MCVYIFLEYNGRSAIAGTFDNYKLSYFLGTAILFHRGCVVAVFPCHRNLSGNQNFVVAASISLKTNGVVVIFNPLGDKSLHHFSFPFFYFVLMFFSFIYLYAMCMRLKSTGGPGFSFRKTHGS